MVPVRLLLLKITLAGQKASYRLPNFESTALMNLTDAGISKFYILLYLYIDKQISFWFS